LSWVRRLSSLIWCSKRSEEQSEGVDIYNEIRKEIERVIDTENPNNFGNDDFDQENYKDDAEEAYNNFYNSQSEGRDIYGEV
jgi:hypothetical protein